MSEHTAMLDLEIHNGQQPVETRQMSRRQPICIGRHASNDVCIDDVSVAPMHCRVAWNGTQLEVAAASRDGVDLNGTFVRHSVLKAGDVLRIGPADLFVRPSGPDGPATIRQQRRARVQRRGALPVIPEPKRHDVR